MTLSYGYQRAVVWLDDLAGERTPHTYDLCPGHTNRLSVPRGWQLEDRRTVSILALGGPRLAG